VSLPYDHELESLLDGYRKSRLRASELQRQIREISATAATPRQTVKVTVGVQGELMGIEFPTGAYKRMAPAELTEAILGAVAEAKAKALESFKELMLPELPGGLNFMDLLQGKGDLTQAMPVDPPMPHAVREYIDTGRVPGRSGGGLDG
jgi:DNA-binding protein YbaB